MKKIIVLFLLMCSLGYSQSEEQYKNEIIFRVAVTNYIVGTTFNDSLKVLTAKAVFESLKNDLKEKDIRKSINFDNLGLNQTNFKNYTTFDKWTKACDKVLKDNVSKKYIPFHKELCLGEFKKDNTICFTLMVVESKLLPNIEEMSKNKEEYKDELKELKEMLVANRTQQKIFFQHVLTEHAIEFDIPNLIYLCNFYKTLEKMLELKVADELDVNKYAVQFI